MIDAVIQLIRNALCCVKDWSLFSDTILYDSNKTSEFLGGVDLPSPLNQTTPLEVIISLTQFWACYR